MGFPGGSAVKNPLAMQKMQDTQVQSLVVEDSLEKGMATHSSILAWKIPWAEEPGGLLSMELQSVNMSEQLSMRANTTLLSLKGYCGSGPC